MRVISNNKLRYGLAGIVAFIGIGALAIVSDFWSTSSERKTYAEIGGDFTLSSENGMISLSDFRGQVVLLFFGYASCPDYCPAELARIARTMRGLSKKDADQTWGIFVNVDPAKDTIEEVSAYARFFHEHILGLTGTIEEVRQVAEKYFAFYEVVENEDSVGGYTIDHSLTTYLIGRDGRVVELINPSWSISQISQAIRTELQR